jgi:hypothetical protein
MILKAVTTGRDWRTFFSLPLLKSVPVSRKQRVPDREYKIFEGELN